MDTPARIVFYGAGYDRGGLRGGQEEAQPLRHLVNRDSAKFIGRCLCELGAKRRSDKEVFVMFEPPPPFDHQPPQAPIVHHISPEQKAVREAARQHEEAARQQLASFLYAAQQGDTLHGKVDKEDKLWMHTRDSEGKVSSQPLMIGDVWAHWSRRDLICNCPTDGGRI
jgi:hypothetical protein